MIEKAMPGTRIKKEIIKEIYKTPGINVSSLIKKVKASPNSVIDYINRLESFGIIKKTLNENKKLVVRNLELNLNSELCILILSILEIEKKLRLINKYPKLNIIFEQLSKAANNSFILVYGSYARFSADKDSDIDIIAVGNNLDKNKFREVLITYPESSLKIETVKTFLLNLKKPLYQNMLKEYVVICNPFEFFNTIKNSITNRS